MKGIITKSTGSWYKVLLEDNTVIDARLRGIFKSHDLKLTNPIAVGDTVEVFKEDNQSTYIIKAIETRKNYFLRKSSRKNHHFHILASNIDLAVLVVSLKQPRTSTGFIDRFSVIVEKQHIPVLIVFNKVDLLKEKHLDKALELTQIYESIGYKTLLCSAETHQSIDELASAIQGKTIMVMGHSGVGKSSLVNCIYPDLDLRIGEISNFTEKGTHTTTHAEMHLLEDGTRLIDTPGIKEIGIADVEPHEVWYYFPEFTKYAGNCKFHNCTHVHEPGCAVLIQLEKGKISEERYKNYLSILQDE